MFIRENSQWPSALTTVVHAGLAVHPGVLKFGPFMLYARSRGEANAPRLVDIGCDYFEAGDPGIFDLATQNMPQHNFQLIQAQRFGQQVLILVDMALDPDRDGPVFPWLVTVRIPMRNSNTEGLCDQAELSRLDQVEDQLLSILNDEDYRFLGHVTGNGRREILLYVREPDAVIAKLKRILSQIGETSGELFKSHDPNWEYYGQFPR